MSTVVAATLSNGTVSTSTANCISGSAKAWVNFDGGTGTIRGAYNVSSVTVVSSGNYVLNFTTAMPNANISLAGMAEWTSGVTNMGILTVKASVLPTTTTATIQCFNSSGTATPSAYIGVSAFSG